MRAAAKAARGYHHSFYNYNVCVCDDALLSIDPQHGCISALSQLIRSKLPVETFVALHPYSLESLHSALTLCMHTRLQFLEYTALA